MPQGVLPRSAALRAPAPATGHCWPMPPQEILEQVWLSLCGVSRSWCPQGFAWAFWASLTGMGFDSKHDFFLPTILLGLLLCSWIWGVFFFFGGIQHSLVNGCSAVSCNFGALTGDEHIRYDRQIAWRTMDRGSWHCIGGTDQDHSKEKAMQKGKMVVWWALTESWEKKRSKRQRRKGKIYPSESRVPKNSKEI